MLRVLTINELMRLTRIELCNLAAKIANVTHSRVLSIDCGCYARQYVS
jgi:hypothetical protein